MGMKGGEMSEWGSEEGGKEDWTPSFLSNNSTAVVVVSGSSSTNHVHYRVPSSADPLPFLSQTPELPLPAPPLPLLDVVLPRRGGGNEGHCRLQQRLTISTPPFFPPNKKGRGKMSPTRVCNCRWKGVGEGNELIIVAFGPCNCAISE